MTSSEISTLAGVRRREGRGDFEADRSPTNATGMVNLEGAVDDGAVS
jgi:hypothetical protein